jgi:predicted nucleotide-binding protein (sugar kinase/HSP70/actin superfamily)
MDFVKPELHRLGIRYRNAFWSYGQKILAALEKAAESEILDVMYLTNFSCGPDSFLLSFAEEIMGKRPLLMLELDEHGADAGYMTRLEAYFDVLRRPCTRPSWSRTSSSQRQAPDRPNPDRRLPVRRPRQGPPGPRREQRHPTGPTYV